MRNNQPVTQQEFEFPDNATLMSTTDTESYVTYANAAFMQVSGFSHEEIQGQPHNVVRHPDMPKEAFADMWSTLKGGEPWTALVKNRRKNGDHYWVRANATPVVRNGKPAGYMSVRTKASREEIAAAEALYRDFREGKAGNRRFHKGLIVRTGLMGWTSVFQTMPVRWRIRSALLSVAPTVALAAWLLGLKGVALAGFAGVSAAVSMFASLWLEAQISRPLEQVREQALRVASGESQKAVHMNRVDEIGMTLRTISQLGLMFRWLIDDVSEQVINVQTASNEIAQGCHERPADSCINDPDDRHREEQRGDCRRGESTFGHGEPRGSQRRAGSIGSRQHDERDHGELEKDCRHHWCDRRNRIPDEHSRAQCGC
jgi:aerotaxis receptor